MGKPLPPYVDYGALMTPPPPFDSKDTTMYGFWAELDGGKVAALCAKVFDETTGGEVRCRPLGPLAMISWGHIGAVSSLTPPYDKRGGVTEPQVAIWIPVAIRDPSSDDEWFAMFMPYIWLNNAMSLATGRELFGYPKAWGEPGFPAAGGPRKWTLDVFGLDYTPGALAAMHSLLEVAESDSVEEAAEAAITSLADVARHIVGGLLHPSLKHLRGDLETAASLTHELFSETVPNVFLKQIRDVSDGTSAALQQVTALNYRIVSISSVPLLREHKLTVKHLDSHPVGEELGLKDQTLGLAYEAKVEFTVGGGRVLWDAMG
jgi:hypothetical protein